MKTIINKRYEELKQKINQFRENNDNLSYYRRRLLQSKDFTGCDVELIRKKENFCKQLVYQMDSLKTSNEGILRNLVDKFEDFEEYRNLLKQLDDSLIIYRTHFDNIIIFDSTLKTYLEKEKLLMKLANTIEICVEQRDSILKEVANKIEEFYFLR